MYILFICSANKRRSKTAEDHFAETFPEMAFKSAGTNIRMCQMEGTTPIDLALLEGADKILVMEDRHRKAIKSLAPKGIAGKIIVLNIRDRYKYGEKALINLLEEKAVPHFASSIPS